MEHYDVAVLINELCNNDITSDNLRRGLRISSSELPRNFFEFICDGIDDGLLELLIENKYGFSPVDNAFLKSKMIEYLIFIRKIMVFPWLETKEWIMPAENIFCLWIVMIT